MTDHPDRKDVDFSAGKGHINIAGEFQSDKYPWCAPGFVPLKITDPMAIDLLRTYARRRGSIDAGFREDLLKVLGDGPTAERPWFGWPTEYMDEGSVVVSAADEAEALAKAREKLNADDDPNEPMEVSVRPVTAEDVEKNLPDM